MIYFFNGFIFYLFFIVKRMLIFKFRFLVYFLRVVYIIFLIVYGIFENLILKN